MPATELTMLPSNGASVIAPPVPPAPPVPLLPPGVACAPIPPLPPLLNSTTPACLITVGSGTAIICAVETATPGATEMAIAPPLPPGPPLPPPASAPDPELPLPPLPPEALT